MSLTRRELIRGQGLRTKNPLAMLIIDNKCDFGGAFAFCFRVAAPDLVAAGSSMLPINEPGFRLMSLNLFGSGVGPVFVVLHSWK